MPRWTWTSSLALLPSVLYLHNALALAETLPIVDLTIANQVIAPDGVQRVASLAGGTLPGPLISAHKGDRLRINVTDALTDKSMFMSTTVHWHGIHQLKTNYADGVAWVTQCPISPGHSFLYEFEVPDQAGTYWYHSHLASQYCDGVKGPLIIYDDEDGLRVLYDVDDESTIITLSDWYHKSSRGLVPPLEEPPIADSVLINGKGRYAGSEEGMRAEIAIVHVEKGKRYRLRLIQMACDTEFLFNIDNHTLDIIEVDGTPLRPYPVDQLTIYQAQRYSAVLHANQEIGNYWIHALPYQSFPGRENAFNFNGGANSALLRYKGAKDEEPPTTTIPPATANTTSSNSDSVKVLKEHELSPLNVEPAPGNPGIGNADVHILITLGVNDNFNFTLNGVAFTSPSVPVLLQILSGAKTVDELLPSGSVYVLPRNKVIEVSIPAIYPGFTHPFHLHGHDMAVVRSGGSNETRFENPVRRDVVNLGWEGDNMTFRFTTDNPGPWFLHCHNDFHLADMGMAVVFAEAPESVESYMDPVPGPWDELCPIYKEMRPDDN